MGNAVGAGLGAASLTQAADPDVGHLQKSSEAYKGRTEDIDESSAEVLCNAMRYATDNAMMIQVQVLGTMKRFWRLTDEATGISRKLALILRSHHSAGMSLTAPLLLSNVWIGRTTGSVKLRDVSFTVKDFGIKRVRDDYKHLYMVLVLLIGISDGNINELPPDYTEFLRLLRSDTLTMTDEFLIVNHAALLPMKILPSQAADPDVGHLQKSSEAYKCSTEDIDESSAEGLCDAERYAKDNTMMIQVQVLGTTKRFWRLTDEATRISRKLAFILRSHHSAGKSLTAPLQVSNVRIGRATGSVKLRDVSFTVNDFSIKRVRDDYKNLSMVLALLISISGGNIGELPPDYLEFLLLLRSNALTMKDEFLIVNHVALLPMKNRTEVFLMLHNIIVKYFDRTKQGRAKKKMILSNLPYENNWLDTAKANQIINQWVDDVRKQYWRTPSDLLRLNRNVRCHSHDYGADDIEEVLYCEWPKLLMVMEKMLHLEGFYGDGVICYLVYVILYRLVALFSPLNLKVKPDQPCKTMM